LSISNIESAVAAFEEKFPEHEFEWKISLLSKRAVGRCPFHSPDNHPSFNIFIGENNKFYYNCFSCHESGSVDMFVGNELSEEDKKRIEENKQKQVALKTLRDKTKENLVYAIENDSLAGQYFCKRTNLSKKIAVDFLEHYSDVGLIDRNIDLPDFIDQKQRERLNNGSYLAFFYRTVDGWITMIHVRKIDTHDFETIKLFKVPSFFTRNSNMFSDTKVIFVVEGEFDAVAMDAALFAENQTVAGDFAFAAVAGTSGYTLEVINEVKKTGAAVVLLPDNDSGGENALINLYKNLKQKKVDTSNIQIARIPDMFDAEDDRVKDVDEWFFGRKTAEIKLYLSFLKIQTLKEYAANIELKEYFETLKNIDSYPANIKQILIKQQGNKFNGSFVENIENVSEAWDKYINRNSDIVNVGGVALQEGAVNLIAADNGIGKTFITLNLCVNYILKKLKRVFFWAGEDDKTTIIKRLNLIFSKMESEEDIQIVKERLDIATYISEPFFKTDFGNVEETKEFKIFQMLMKDDQYGMIVLDPLSTFLMMITEVDNTKVRWGMTKFNKIVSESDKILIFTHHINKDSIRGDGSLKELNKKLQNGENMNPHEVIDIANGLKAAIRGGMAITDLPRLVYFVLATQPSADGYAQRLLFRIKSNAGLTQEYIPIKLPFKSQIQQTSQNQDIYSSSTEQGNTSNNQSITKNANNIGSYDEFL
jgi:hypothetical protein